MRKFGLLALIVPTILAASIAAAPAFALQGGSSAYPTASGALSAEITSKLDTKNATVGEAVTAKTLSSTTLANGTAIPRGAMLNGKVTAVQSSGTASVTISFDQVLASKKASPISIHGVVVGVAPKPYISGGGASANNLPLSSTRSEASLSGETGQTIDNMGAPEEFVATGSSLKNVTLASGTLTSSHGDIKLDHGTRIAIALASN
jgi:hypothetical protein